MIGDASFLKKEISFVSFVSKVGSSGSKVFSFSVRRYKILQLVQETSEFLCNSIRGIAMAGTGTAHMAVVTETGNLWTWGWCVYCSQIAFVAAEPLAVKLLQTR